MICGALGPVIFSMFRAEKNSENFPGGAFARKKPFADRLQNAAR
jgi:hypothetical protein